MNKKIVVIGFFAYNTEYNGGQENKTRALYELIKSKYGDENVHMIDTLGWKKKPLSLFFKTIKIMKKCDVAIMLPAAKGVKVFSKLLLMLKNKKTKIFYSVIGGWLPALTSKNKVLKKDLQKFDGIWVETKSMMNDLTEQGFKNIRIVPNFKKIKSVSETKIKTNFKIPYKICTFSRVLKEKGIEDAIEVVKKINDKYKRVVYELDIYGRIDSNYESDFAKLQENFPHYIKYKGVVPYTETVEVIKKYFFLLFPTRFKTEGIPGTIIDAYASAVPVLSARWNSYNDVIVDGVTGIGFSQCDNNDLEKKMIEIIENPKIISSKKKKCLEEFSKYTEEYVFKTIKDII